MVEAWYSSMVEAWAWESKVVSHAARAASVASTALGVPSIHSTRVFATDVMLPVWTLEWSGVERVCV